MNTSEESGENLVFNYLILRRIVGAIAFSFSLVVYLLARSITSSISASYHTDARDVFVGFLFIIGILLIAYKGHEHKFAEDEGQSTWSRLKRFWGKHEEEIVSTIGGAAAIATALFPTACDGCTTDVRSHIHATGATILFSTVVYFCLVAFLRRVLDKLKRDDKGRIIFFQNLKEAFHNDDGNVSTLHRLQAAFAEGVRTDGRKLLRGCIYLICGVGIAVIMLSVVAAQFWVLEETRNALHIMFWAESAALCLFGISWITASQMGFFKDQDEKEATRQTRAIAQSAV